MPTRRSFLGALAATACAASSRPGTSGVGAPADPGDSAPLDPITSNDDFYRIYIAPTVPDEATIAAWTLTLATEDGNEVVLTPADVEAIGGEEQERTLCCIGGSSSATVGNAMWTATRLDDLLDAVDLRPDARLAWVRFTAFDGYTTCVPRSDLAKGLALAWRMNGVALPLSHGAPFRALVPGRYGMKNPKWIQRIDFIAALEAGFWESRGWSQDAEYQVASWFVAPAAGAEVTPDGAWLKGIAFAGEAGIERVDVSDDGGLSWFEAEITYPGGPGVWTLWRVNWVPPAPGAYTLLVRATAADGRVQADLELYDGDLDGLEALDPRGVTAT